MGDVHVMDPYAVPGRDRKAQLHCHTTHSDGRCSPQEVAERYRAAGFSFLALTDHGVVTDTSGLSDSEFCVVPGVELTVPRPFRPLGPHLACLLIASVPRGRGLRELVVAVEEGGGICGLNHPSWTGNLWTGRWNVRWMRGVRGYRFVEVYNPHSDPEWDTRFWAQVARICGADHPVFPVASDDFHHDAQLGRGWVVVRVPEVSADSLRQALRSGAVYATTGPQASFGVRQGAVVVESDAAQIRFYDAAGRLKLHTDRGVAEYVPHPTDGFVRVECLGRTSGRAWSGCFWVLPGDRRSGVQGDA